MTRIRAHFDGRVIVPDQPVDLPVDQPLDIAITPYEQGLDANGTANSDSVQRLNEFFQRPTLGELPLDQLRRENLYEDRA